MKNNKLFKYVILTSIGFVLAIGAGLFMINQNNKLLQNFGNLSKEIHAENAEKIENLVEINLTNIVKYMERRYPFLNDPERLKLESDSTWFWDMADEWHEIANSFNLPSIYYAEKKGDSFVSLMSSQVRRNYRANAHLSNVWAGEPPAFFNEAWETGKLTIAPEPYTNEYGTFITAANPIIVNGKVAGILAAAYEISFLDNQKLMGLKLEEQENVLLQKIQGFFIVSVLFVLVIIAFQIWLIKSSVLISGQKHDNDELTRLMLESTPMLCALWDNNGMPIDCDQKTLNILGLSAKEDYIKHFFDLCPEYQQNGESTRDKARKVLSKAFETGYERQEWILRSITGENIPVDASFVRIPWKGGYCLAVYARDLRGDKEKEAALQESENRLRLMLDNMSIPCYIFDSEGNLIDCNQQAIAFFSFENKEDFINEFFYLSPEHQRDGKRSSDEAKALVKNAFETGQDSFIWEHISKDGTPLHADVTLKRVQWKDGYRVIAYLQDRCKLVETEDKLKMAQSTVDASPNMIMFIGESGNIEYMNPSLSKVSGFSKEELQRDGLALIFSTENFIRLNKEFLRASLQKRNPAVNFEMTVTTKSGEELDYSFSSYGVTLFDGSTGIGLTGRNITEFKKMQRDLAVAKDQAEKALAGEKEYNKAKSDFLSRVSHELRTPLNAIIGLTNVAGKTYEEAETVKCYDKIKEASNSLLWLVNDIVDITSYDTGAFEFTSEPFSFSKAMTSVIENVNARVQAKDQIFDINIEEGITDWLNSDERRLKQVLLNLLLNAVKFTPEKGKIQLIAKELSNNGNECILRFEVIDDGQGIPPEMLAHLGEVLEQADNSITREHGGLGLGLSLTKRIIEIMKGSISVKSEPGKGSRFICDLHFDIAKTEEQNESYSSTEDAPDTVDLAGKRILVVDDVEINREILLAMLEETGAVLHQASTGDEAVKMFNQDEYNLVLMDLHMPLMDGFAATKNIRSSGHPLAKVVPVISISAESSGDLATKCLEAGINDHIAKPIGYETLYKVISKWVTEMAA